MKRTSSKPTINSAFTNYMRALANIPLLGTEISETQFNEAIHFIRLHINSENETLKNTALFMRQRCINACVKIVVKRAKSYIGRGLDFMELVSEGNIGLMKCLDSRYNPDYGVKVITYVTWYIDMQMRYAIARNFSTVVIPIWVYELVSRFKRTKYKLEQELGRMPTLAEVSKYMELSDNHMTAITDATRETTSINCFDPNKNNAPVGNLFETLLEERETSDILEELIEDENIQNVMKKFARLPERDQMILKMRYGVNDERKTHTLQEIGDRLGISRERVRQLEVHATKELALLAAH